MLKTIILRSIKQQSNAIAVIQDITFDPIHEIVIRESKEALSSRQRRLYFRWLTDIANDQGEDKDELHLSYKGKYLVDIYRRDDAEYEAMCEAVNNVHRAGLKADAALLRKEIVRRTSIMDANTKQMAEYMQCIDVEATMKGVELTRPEDYGIKETK